jgi:branched-chain amino acid transport system ATP-binding protein
VFAICDVITVLSYGKVLATGTKDEIRSNSRVIEAYLGQHHA